MQIIEQIQLFFKDPAKVAKAATVGFFVFVAISLWFLFNLENDLVMDGGMIASHRSGGVIVKLGLVVSVAFGFCYAIIFFMQRTKKETIVYLDKKMASDDAQHGSMEGYSTDNINANVLRQKINSAAANEKLQAGLNELCNQLRAGQGALYTTNKKGEEKMLDLACGYALVLQEGEQPSFFWGEGLIGQVAASGKTEYLDELPEGYAARIESGLGSALPKFLYVFPIKKENETVGVIEVATFTGLSESLRKQAAEAGHILSEIS
ncbi:MAG TPA: GAF domain-containing protein [Cyclobacteriaceae bacterium]|jgi:hypothetical protein|nr:GAF domain-containing protein [Cyclobacteriaceae bacterium]